MKNSIIYKQESNEIAKAIECGKIIEDFLPKPDMLLRKRQPKQDFIFSAKFSSPRSRRLVTGTL